MDDIPCPQCGSTNTLSGLRRKLRKVKGRIAEEECRAKEERRKAAAVAAKAAVGSSTHPLNMIKGGGVIAIHGLVSHGLAVGHGHQRTTISLGQVEGGLIANDDEQDLLSINGVKLETCAECGTFYAPNAKDKAEEILTEIYKLDILGAMAEI